MNKIFYISSCDTCRKIIKALPANNHLIFCDIKQNPMSEDELDQLYSICGSYELLFSKKAQLYKSMTLKDKNLTEADYKELILQHYTFLRRPVFLIDNQVFIGSTQQNLLKVYKALAETSII